MPLSDLITINISTLSNNVSAVGYGVPLLLSTECPVGFTERVRTYTSLASVVVDFATTTATYKMAAKIFGQTIHPASIKIGRRALKPTMVWTIPVVTVANSLAYKLKVGSTIYTYTADASATNDEIATGLAAAADAHADVVGTTSGGAGSLVVVLTGASAGLWVNVQVLNSDGEPAITHLGLAQTHADAGIATDMAAILAENKDWYTVHSADCSEESIKELTSWVESNGKLYIAATQDSACASAASGGTDVMQDLETAAYVRTSVWYHPDNAQFIDCALAGRVLPIPAGGESWAYKTLAGVSVYTLTPTQRANILAKHGNLYETQGGVNMTFNGSVAGGTWLDLVRGRDALASASQEAHLAVLLANDKVSYDDDGIGLFKAAQKAVLRRFVTSKLLTKSPEPTVTAVPSADVSGANKTARHYDGLSFAATLAGAVNTLAVTGTLTE